MIDANGQLYYEQIHNLLLQVYKSNNRFYGFISILHNGGLRTTIFNAVLSDYNNTIETLDYHIARIRNYNEFGYAVFTGDFVNNTSFTLHDNLKEAKESLRQVRNTKSVLFVKNNMKSIAAQKTLTSDNIVYCYDDDTFSGIVSVTNVF